MKLTRREWSLSAAALAVKAGVCGCSSSREEQSGGMTAVEPRPKSLLERSIVLDLHCDTPMLIMDEGYDLGQRHDYGQVDIPRMREGGVTGVFFSIYTSAIAQTPRASVEKALEIMTAVIKEVARHPADLMRAVSTSDIERAKQQNKVAILMGVEGGHMIDSSLAHLRNFHQLGVCYMTLTHSADTPWAGSSGAKGTPKGLTSLGREVVREMNRLGMIVDVSHVSDQTFFDVVETSSAPVIASHSSCRAVANHPRNLTDEMLQALARNGGVAHINYYNVFLDEEYRQRSNALPGELLRQAEAIRKQVAYDNHRRSVELRKIDEERIRRLGRIPLSRLLDHLEHAAKVAGVEHVGLGSDFDGVNGETPEGMEDISKTPNLVTGLQERGLSEIDIQKILGGNTLRVMREAKGIAEKAEAV